MEGIGRKGRRKGGREEGKFFLIEGCQLINVERMVEIES